ncbi:MAG: carboxypeptidase-like regulatory domain-containing protein [Chitinophagales bacterium]
MNNLHKNLFFIYFALCFCFNAQAQMSSGAITGTIKANEDGQEAPVFSANIVLKGNTDAFIGTTTDFDGLYKLDNVAAGNYELIISYVGFDADTMAIAVKEGEIVNINKTLEQNVIVMQAVEVKAKANRENTAIQLLDRKDAGLLTENVGAKEMSEQGVSSAVEGLAKVSGISTQSGKYFLVRGLGDRYNNALLNGMPVASLDPDKKVIPLNIFPTSVMQSLSVYKSFSPELYGDFAGGTAEIATKNYPEERILEFGVGVSCNTQAAFKPFAKYDSGKGSYFGLAQNNRQYDNGLDAQDVNDRYKSTTYEGGNVFANSNNVNFINAPLGNAYSLRFGDFIGAADKSKGIGFLLAANYSNSYNFEDGYYRIVNKQGDEALNYNYENYAYNTNTSLLATIGWKLNEKNNISLNAIMLNQSNDNVRDSEGFHFDYTGDVASRRLSYKQNNLMNFQLTGTHQLMANDRLQFNWAQTYNIANAQEPDRRQFAFTVNENGDYLFNRRDPNSTHRFFSALNENELSNKAEFVFNAIENESKPAEARWKIKAGFNYKNKNRDFDYRHFNYDINNSALPLADGETFDINNIDNYLNATTHEAGVFSIEEKGDLASKQDMSLNVMAAYLNNDFDILPNTLKLIAGVRFETATQSLAYKAQNAGVHAPPVTQKAPSSYLLPAMSLKFTPSKQNVWWLTASKTISRPNFKELAPFEYIEFFAGEIASGNPSLKNGINYNFDARYEFYPSSSELISVGTFFKYLDSPIERINIAASSGRKVSYVNVNGATLAGLELEIRKQLTFLNFNDNTNFTAGLNASYLYSRIKIDENTLADGIAVSVTNTERALQGASPFLINANLNYRYQTQKMKTNVSLAYNVFGKRIVAAGTRSQGSDGGLQDTYEMPYHSLDLVVRNKFNNKLGINLSVKNILNSATILQQDTDDGVKELNNFKRGVGISFGLSYDLL